MKHISQIIKDNYNFLDFSKKSTKDLRKELKELQIFLSEETSSIGRTDFLIEQAMIKELHNRAKSN